MTYKVLLPVALVMLFSCAEKPKEYQLKVKLNKLTIHDLYNKDMVSDVLFDAEEMNVDSLKKESKKLFLQAMDKIKNKKEIKQGIGLLISSILTFPEAKAYYELGNAFLDLPTDHAMSIADALKAYEVAQHLNFQPAANVYYQKACAYNMLHLLNAEDSKVRDYEVYDIANNLEYAFSNGFSDTAALKTDKRISSFTSTSQYREIVSAWLTSAKTNSSNTLFAQFKRSFPPVSGRFEITLDNVDMHNYEESVNYDFAEFIPEMQNTSFGRDVSHEYFYVNKIAETPEYTALVYRSTSFYEGEMNPVTTTLVTYGNNGEIISRKIISCYCSAEKVKSCVIENNTIEVSDYKRVWENPIDKVPFEDNKIKLNELVSKATYSIADGGKIIDKDVPAGSKDSTTTASFF